MNASAAVVDFVVVAVAVLFVDDDGGNTASVADYSNTAFLEFSAFRGYELYAVLNQDLSAFAVVSFDFGVVVEEVDGDAFVVAFEEVVDDVVAVIFSVDAGTLVSRQMF